jgi:hypothetical protein
LAQGFDFQVDGQSLVENAHCRFGLERLCKGGDPLVEGAHAIPDLVVGVHRDGTMLRDAAFRNPAETVSSSLEATRFIRSESRRRRRPTTDFANRMFMASTKNPAVIQVRKNQGVKTNSAGIPTAATKNGKTKPTQRPKPIIYSERSEKTLRVRRIMAVS